MPPSNPISIKRVPKRQHSDIRLMCFAGAGSGASYFSDWQAFASPEIDICAIQLPRREDVVDGRRIAPLGNLISQITERMTDLLDVPFAFFGHSLGALIGFEVARHLSTYRGVSPSHLYISGCRAPQVPRLRPAISHLADQDFADEICRNYDYPREISNDLELMQITLPTLRYHFQIFEEYKYHHGSPLSSGITVFAGAEDRSLSRAALRAWREQTSSSFDLKLLAGNHILSKVTITACYYCRVSRRYLLTAAVS